MAGRPLPGGKEADVLGSHQELHSLCPCSKPSPGRSRAGKRLAGGGRMTKPAPATGHRREGPVLPPLISSCSESLRGREFVKYCKLDETWRTSTYWSHMRDRRWVSGRGRTVRGQALVLGFHPSGTNSPGDVGSQSGARRDPWASVHPSPQSRVRPGRQHICSPSSRRL